MRGRELFRLAGPVLFLVELISRVIPKRVLKFLFSLVRWVPGLPGLGIRYVFVKRLCKSCGENVAVFEGVFIHHPENLEIGSNVSIHEMCYLDAAGGIKIGNDVSIAHGVTIVSSNHDYSSLDAKIRDAPVVLAPVTIGDDVWIGAGVRILAGVRVGSGSVIGAGAVVTREIPPYSIAVGVPARVLKSRLVYLTCEGKRSTI